MNLISTLDFISFIFSILAGLITIKFWGKTSINIIQKLSIALIIATTIINNLLSFIEWLSFPIHIQAVNITDYLQILQPLFWGILYYIFIITRQQQAVLKSHQRMRSIVENMPVILQAIDKKGRVIAWNKHAEEVCGYSKKELVNNKYSINFFNAGETSDANAIRTPDELDTQQRIVRTITCKNGHEKIIAWSDISKTHPIPGWKSWGIGFDISDEYRKQKKLQYIATHDTLTGLPNHDHLKLSLKQLIDTGKGFTLLFIDINNFERINDTIGYKQTNKAMVKIGEVLNDAISVEGGAVYKLQINGFYLLFEGITAREQIDILVHTILNKFSIPITLSSTAVISISINIGASIFPNDSNTVDDIIQNTNIAMHSAKSKGPNRFHYFSPPMEENIKKQIRIADKLNIAIEKNELHLHYQPQICSQRNITVGAEALLRWSSDGGKNISPGEFIPVAEKFGLISKIGTWAMEEACSSMAPLLRNSNLNSLSINVSSDQFYNKNFVDEFISIAKNEHIPLEKIDLEITESLLISDNEKAIRVMKKLRSAGFTLSLDDFGTGYSSLAYLKDFPIQKIKIDQAFIRNIHIDKTNQAIAKSILNLGFLLDKKIIAEGVETIEELNFLNTQNCYLIQGYYFSKPLPLDSFLAWKESMALGA